MITLADFLDHFRRQRRWTLSVVGAIPSRHFDWAPAKGAFSCGDLVRHLMQAEIFWCRLLTAAAAGESLDPFGLEGAAEERMQSFRGRNLESSHNTDYGASAAECVERWSKIQQRTETELGALPDSALVDVVIDHPLTRLEAPLWEGLLVMIEHEAHHRGQLSAYLKMLEVEQPAAAIAT